MSREYDSTYEGQLQKCGDEIVLPLARVIPEREAWLYDNKEAQDAVRRGLEQARSRTFAKRDEERRLLKSVVDVVRENITPHSQTKEYNHDST
jgi:hypothetical protein